MRRDLADVRLAERVFAPHYAAPMPRSIAAPTTLRSTNAADSDALAELEPGDIFELLDLTGGWAWGVAAESRLVGYVAADAVGARA